MFEMIAKYSIVAIGSAAGSIAVIGSSEFSDPILQLGALGVLGVSSWYLLSHIVPSAMKQRQEESAEFVKAIRELSIEHATEIKEARRDSEATVKAFYTDAKEEREVWRTQISQLNETMKDTNTSIGQLAKAFRENKQS